MKKNNNKVYCDNCKHKHYEEPAGGSYCHAGYKLIEYNEFNNMRMSDFPSDEITREFKFNEKGDCPYYKRKWYKFWINK